MKVVRSGVTRDVILVSRWAVKVPKQGKVDGVPRIHGRVYCFVEGWLCNQSEWRQRRRPDVARPLFTVGHVAAVYPRADAVGSESIVGPWDTLKRFRPDGLWWGGDESKASSWGRFGDRFLIIDYAHPIDDQTFIGRLFYSRWASRLVDADPAWRSAQRPFRFWRARRRSPARATTVRRSRGNSPVLEEQSGWR